MFRVINIRLVLKFIAVGTSFLSILVYEVFRKHFDTELPAMKVLSIAPWIAAGIFLIFTTDTTARYIWKVVRFFKRNLFPDLNGTWQGEIIVSDTHRIPARAIIVQSLEKVSIDIHTETSKSITLEVTPTIEYGCHRLYYLYRSIPRQPGWAEYKGTTTFDIRKISDGLDEFLELSGVYFTERKTVGRVRFWQVSGRADFDVSFY